MLVCHLIFHCTAVLEGKWGQGQISYKIPCLWRLAQSLTGLHCQPSHLRAAVKKLGINQVEVKVELQASHGLAGTRETLLLAKSGTLLLSDFHGQCLPALVPHSSEGSVLWVQAWPLTLAWLKKALEAGWVLCVHRTLVWCWDLFGMWLSVTLSPAYGKRLLGSQQWSQLCS